MSRVKNSILIKVVLKLNEAKILMKFNEDNKLIFIVEGTILQELQINEELKEKINYLINKSDTSNFLIRVNGAFDIDEAIQKTFEDTINNQFDKEKK